MFELVVIPYQKKLSEYAFFYYLFIGSDVQRMIILRLDVHRTFGTSDCFFNTKQSIFGKLGSRKY